MSGYQENQERLAREIKRSQDDARQRNKRRFPPEPSMETGLVILALIYLAVVMLMVWGD